MSAEHTQDASDPKAVEADNMAFVERMRALIKGEVEPPDEQISYVLQAFKDDTAEFEAAQKNLVAAQESLLRLRGRLESREADLRHWDKKNQAK